MPLRCELWAGAFKRTNEEGDRIKKLIPHPLKRVLARLASPMRESAFSAAALDARRFNQHSQLSVSSTSFPASAAKADLLRKMHSLEKGLALPNPVPGFGVAKARDLIQVAEKYRDRHDEDWHFRTCVSVLQEYAEFQAQHGNVYPELDEFLAKYASSEPGGTITINRASKSEEPEFFDFGAFARSRHSVRIFAPQPVDEALILEAIDIARKTPSVCNRSSGRVYLTMDRANIDAALEIQSGARGFSHTVPCLLIVASDLSTFYKVGERNQPFIDGGLFAMTLVYALHGLGLGACMLNWSKTPAQDKKLRKVFQIENAHNIIMMVAVGHMPEEVRVALSPRAGVESFYQRLERKKEFK